MTATVTSGPTRRLRRVLKLLAVNVLATLIGAELAAYGVARWRLGLGYRSIDLQKAQVLESLPAVTDDDALGPAQHPPDNIERVLHPFFGFTFRPRDPRWRTNNMGFFAPVDFPYRRAPGELVVGIFGGSFALALRCPPCLQALREQIASAVKAKGYDAIVVLVYAQGAWKAPQTVISFLYYIDTVDVAVFVDGVNEIAQIPLPDDASPGGYPWDFPAPAFYRDISGAGRRASDAARIGKIAWTRQIERRLTRSARHGVLGQSMLVHMLWRVAMGAAERSVARNQQALRAPSQDTYGGLFDSMATLDDCRREYFERYAGWMQACHDAARARRKVLIHFLQPNQYVPGSKRFSDREKETCLGDDNMRKVVTKLYPWLIGTSHELEARGVPSVDLTMTLRDATDTYYRDACCHMNDSGMTAVARIIGQRIVASGILEDLPAAGTPGPRTIGPVPFPVP